MDIQCKQCGSDVTITNEGALKCEKCGIKMPATNFNAEFPGLGFEDGIKFGFGFGIASLVISMVAVAIYYVFVRQIIN